MNVFFGLELVRVETNINISIFAQKHNNRTFIGMEVDLVCDNSCQFLPFKLCQKECNFNACCRVLRLATAACPILLEPFQDFQ